MIIFICPYVSVISFLFVSAVSLGYSSIKAEEGNFFVHDSMYLILVKPSHVYGYIQRH